MSQIRTLEQLQKEKQKVRLKIEVSKQEFEKSLTHVKADSKDFLVKKVAIPAGIAGLTGLAGFGISKIATASKKKKQEKMLQEKYEAAAAMNYEAPKESAFSKWKGLIMKLLPIGIQLAQSYFLANDEDE